MLRVKPLCGELVRSRLSHDCQGKKDNVGFRMTARAVSKTGEALQEEEEDGRTAMERQRELAEFIAALCKMDFTEVMEAWSKDINQCKKENRREFMEAEDSRLRRLVAFLLKQEADCVGLVAHPMLFQRLLQLYCPLDKPTQEQLRVSLRDGVPGADAKDPLKDKMASCSVLLLTFRYHDLGEWTEACRSDAEIVAAQFLFGGRMEGALLAEERTADVPDDPEECFDDLDDLLCVAVEANRRADEEWQKIDLPETAQEQKAAASEEGIHANHASELSQEGNADAGDVQEDEEQKHARRERKASLLGGLLGEHQQSAEAGQAVEEFTRSRRLDALFADD